MVSMTNLMAAFFLFMSSSSCLAMAFLWADDDGEDEEEVPFSGKIDFRRFLAGGGGAPEVMRAEDVKTSDRCKFRTRI